jgi:hypothetical protein
VVGLRAAVAEYAAGCAWAGTSVTPPHGLTKLYKLIRYKQIKVCTDITSEVSDDCN